MGSRKNKTKTPPIGAITIRPASEEESATAINALDRMLAEYVRQVRVNGGLKNDNQQSQEPR